MFSAIGYPILPKPMKPIDRDTSLLATVIDLQQDNTTEHDDTDVALPFSDSRNAQAGVRLVTERSITFPIKSSQDLPLSR